MQLSSFPKAVRVLDEAGEEGSRERRDSRNCLLLANALIQKVEGESEKPFCWQIKQSVSHWAGVELTVSATTEEEREEWINTLLDLTNQANDKISQLRSKEKQACIAAELSALVVYCQATTFSLKGHFSEMCSFSETKLEKLMSAGLAAFNQARLSRVYPNASRVTSTNFNPLPMWSAGVQMVALNYQTPDRAMQLNQGRFAMNRQAGYVLKPAFMMAPDYSPDDPPKPAAPAHLTITVIAGRHLARRDRARGGILSPYVEVEVVGLSCDNSSHRTKTISSNGLAPVWEEVVQFSIHFPEAALLRFYVEDGDFVGPGTDPFVGQYTVPVTAIRDGFRSVPLLNEFSEQLELAALLVHVSYRNSTPGGPADSQPAGLWPAQPHVPLRQSHSHEEESSEVEYVNTPSPALSTRAMSTSVTPSPLPLSSQDSKKKGGRIKQLFRFASKKDSSPSST